MILTNKFLFLLSVAASSFAAPLVENDAIKYEERDIVNLHSRNAGVIPDSVTCGTVTIPKAKILDALTASRTPGLSDSSVNNPDGKEYPAFYGNKGTDGRGKTGSVLSFAAARKAQAAETLLEQPLRPRGTWTSGNPGLYRVIFDRTVRDIEGLYFEGSYMGVVYHTTGGEFKRCSETAAPACPAPTLAPTTRTRRVWDMLRRAAGRKPTKPKTKTPANCKKHTTKKHTTKKHTTKKHTTKKPTTKKPTNKRPTERPSTKKPKKGGRF